MLCTIRIPETTRHLSVFADGIVENVIRMQDGSSLVFFDNSYPIAVYYKIHGHRIVYLCIAEFLLPEYPKMKLSGIQKKITVFAQLKGRAYDRYKRITYILFKKEPAIRYLPFTFFQRLAYLCKTGKNSLENVKILLFKYKIKIELKTKEIKT